MNVNQIINNLKKIRDLNNQKATITDSLEEYLKLARDFPSKKVLEQITDVLGDMDCNWSDWWFIELNELLTDLKQSGAKDFPRIKIPRALVSKVNGIEVIPQPKTLFGRVAQQVSTPSSGINIQVISDDLSNGKSRSETDNLWSHICTEVIIIGKIYKLRFFSFREKGTGSWEFSHRLYERKWLFFWKEITQQKHFKTEFFNSIVKDKL